MFAFLKSIDINAIWLFLLVAFIVVETLTTTLVTIWFALGTLVALLSGVFGAPEWLQVVLFVLSSALFLILTRPLAKKIVQPKNIPTNSDRVIGQKGIVTEQIDNLKEQGSVFIDGKEWTARSEDDDITIEKGEKVLILRIAGVKLYVKPNNIKI